MVYAEEDEQILSFLSTLESEKPMNQKGLEREIERCLWKLSDDPSNEELCMFARHFAQWGAKHLADDSKTSPNDLEEAAEKYSKERAEGHILYDWVHAFIAGAKWQKEQMMKEAVEGEVCIPNVWVEHKEGKELVVRAEISKELGFKFGDKVRIIIVKEDL